MGLWVWQVQRVGPREREPELGAGRRMDPQAGRRRGELPLHRERERPQEEPLVPVRRQVVLLRHPDPGPLAGRSRRREIHRRRGLKEVRAVGHLAYPVGKLWGICH